jgi:hypothetical protein
MVEDWKTVSPFGMYCGLHASWLVLHSYSEKCGRSLASPSQRSLAEFALSTIDFALDKLKAESADELSKNKKEIQVMESFRIGIRTRGIFENEKVRWERTRLESNQLFLPPEKYPSEWKPPLLP